MGKRLRKNDCCWEWGFPICTDFVVDEALNNNLSLERHLFGWESCVRRPTRFAIASAFHVVVRNMVNHESPDLNDGRTSSNCSPSSIAKNGSLG